MNEGAIRTCPLCGRHFTCRHTGRNYLDSNSIFPGDCSGYESLGSCKCDPCYLKTCSGKVICHTEYVDVKPRERGKMIGVRVLQ